MRHAMFRSCRQASAGRSVTHSDFSTRLDGRDMSCRPEHLDTFCTAVVEHYSKHGRDLPWRRTTDAYEILVSEMMLQQTQVARVLPKYRRFLDAFPTMAELAKAPAVDVLSIWQGLGYNRRGLALHRTAQIITREHGGRVPDSPASLRALPGIGPATAAAVCVFSYNAPLVFIETNIRAAFIHHFFQDRADVDDREILPLVELTLDRHDPRSWYYALMDYGVWVKRQFSNPSRKSRHHTTQSPFAGSHRELRAEVLRALLSAAPRALTAAEAHSSPALSGREVGDVAATLDELCSEGFLVRTGAAYRVTGAGGSESRCENR